MRVVRLLALAAVVTLGSDAAVQAHDHRVPGANLHVNSKLKLLRSWSSSWSERTGPNECSTLFADGIPTFRPRVRVDHRHAKPRIVFHKRHRPRVRAFADDRLRNGFPPDPKAVDLTLRRAHRHGGRRVWVAKLRPTVEEKLFVYVHASWRDREGCGGSQSASWDFSLRRAR